MLYSYIALYSIVHVADKAPTYGELIDILDYAEEKCLDCGTVAEILCSKVKVMYPAIRIV